VTRAERTVLATSQARDLCLSLRRAFLGPRALERLRAGQASLLTPDELRVALGLAWAAGDLALVRAAFAGLPADRIAADATLTAFLDASRRRQARGDDARSSTRHRPAATKPTHTSPEA
jgi:hypothetical protein